MFASGNAPESVFKSSSAPPSLPWLSATSGRPEHAHVSDLGVESIADSVARVLEHIKRHRHQSGISDPSHPRSLTTLPSR